MTKPPSISARRKNEMSEMAGQTFFLSLQFKILVFFLTNAMKQPMDIVHMLCMSPEQKPLATAKPM